MLPICLLGAPITILSSLITRFQNGKSGSCRFLLSDWATQIYYSRMHNDRSIVICAKPMRAFKYNSYFCLFKLILSCLNFCSRQTASVFYYIVRHFSNTSRTLLLSCKRICNLIKSI